MTNNNSLLNSDQDRKDEDKTIQCDANECFDRLGFRSWSPDWLQRFNNIKWFMVALCLSTFAQGIIIGVTMASLPTIEKEFGISSKMTGIIFAGYDSAALVFVSIVSFFGTRGNKPKWLGIGSFVTALGVMLFVLPKLLVGSYNPPNYSGNQTMSFDICNQNKSTDIIAGCDTTGSGNAALYTFVLFAGQFVIGAGTSPAFTLGPAFIDEHVAPRDSPIYLGILFSPIMLGPGVGLVFGGIFLRTFTDVVLPEGMEQLTSNDPRWIGAWWLGFVCFSGIFVISGFIIILFPAKLKSDSSIRDKSIKAGHLPSPDQSIVYTFKGYIAQNLAICKNKFFMLATFGATIEAIFATGVATFIVKVLIIKFEILPENAGIYLGAILMPSLVIGTLSGSLILSRVKVQFAARGAAKICCIITMVAVAGACIFLIPGCKTTNMAGAKIPYHNSTSMNSLLSMCNDKCMCSEKYYMPICGSDSRTYHSPCFAGCKVFSMKPDQSLFFGNCTCIPKMSRKYGNKSIMVNNQAITNTTVISPANSKQLSTMKSMKTQMETMMTTLQNTATLGKCDRSCKNFYLFVITLFISLLVAFMAATPNNMLVIRSVPDNQRSFALGTQSFIMKCFSSLPAPVLLGTIIDSHCMTWGFNNCGEKKNCYDYNIEELSISIALLGVIASVLSSICYALAWWWGPVNYSPENNNSLLNISIEEDSV